MAHQHIYTIKLDSELDIKLNEFKKQLKADEEIVDISIGEGHVVILTKEVRNKHRNLLVEELVKKTGQNRN